MQKTLLRLAVVLSFFMFVSQSFAAGRVYLGYCDGELGKLQSSLQGAAAADISAAIRLNDLKLLDYTGAKIVGIRVGIGALESGSYPEITGWVRSDLDGVTTAPIAAKSITPTAFGWATIMFDEQQQHTITSQDARASLYVGFSYHSTDKSLLFLTNEDPASLSCFVKYNEDGYQDYSTTFGALSIEAIVEGDNIPERDIAIVSAQVVQPFTKLGETIDTRVTIKNKGVTPCTNYGIKITLNGEVVMNLGYLASLEMEETLTCFADVPTNTVTSDGEINIGYILEWEGEDEEDGSLSDNTYSLTTTLLNEVYPRMIVAEVGLANWDGWTPRGIVNMQKMRELHASRFLSIGVANGNDNPYLLKEYDKWLGLSAFPSAKINRVVSEAEPSRFETILEELPAVSDVSLKLMAYNITGNTYRFNSTFKSARDCDGSKYKFAFVVLEDKLPINQKNNYSGGNYGEMGGFEDLPIYCDIELNNVARVISPSPTGAADQLPEKIAAGTEYNVVYDVDFPEGVNPDNAWGAVLVLDAESGEVVQATYTTNFSGYSQIDSRNVALKAEFLQPVGLLGGTVKTRITLKNTGTRPIEYPAVSCCTMPGRVSLFDESYPNLIIQPYHSHTIECELPLDCVNEAGDVDLFFMVYLNVQDEDLTDNYTTITLPVVEEAYERTMVGEVVLTTGSLSLWCPRGIAYLRQMRQQHSARFLGVAVYAGENAYSLPDYSQFLHPVGYPQAFFNRQNDKEGYDPMDLPELYDAAPGVSDVDMELTASLLSDGNTLNFNTTVTFLTNHESHNYRLAYLLLEDGVPVETQNIYGNGSQGAMGGFENLSDPCEVEVDNVARAIYPNHKGAKLLPEQIKAMTSYDINVSYDKTTLLNYDKAWAAVLLIDGDTGEILQAAKTMYISGLSDPKRRIKAKYDLNDDGEVSIEDITRLTNYILKRH